MFILKYKVKKNEEKKEKEENLVRVDFPFGSKFARPTAGCNLPL